jgi:hypothetical protein
MTTTVCGHKTIFQLSKWFDYSILIFGNSADKNTPRQNVSDDNSTSIWTSPNVFYSFLFPPLFLPFDKRAVWLSHFAVNLFASLTIPRPKQTKSLQFQPHFFGFFKPSLAIPNLAHYIFAKNRQNYNKLSCLPTQIGVLCTLGGHLAPLSQKPKPQACGIFSYYNDT